MHRLLAALLVAGAAACAGQTEVTYRATLPATTAMVEVQPDVYAVADQDEPVFFVNNFYWRFHDGRWYRNGGATGDWVLIGRPPAIVASIRTPHRYVHYRPQRHEQIVIRDQQGRWHRR